MRDCLDPSLLLSQTHPGVRGLPGRTADALARAAAEGFYRSVEIPDIADRGERRRIAALVAGHRMTLTSWASVLTYEERLDLASLEPSIRRASVDRIRGLMGPAAECGARRFGILGGLDPGPARRHGALDALFDSLVELSDALAPHAPMQLVLEPLDRGAHKNGIIGPTDEVLRMGSRLSEAGRPFAICWDSAHMALCGEDIVESFASCEPLMSQVHFANAVLDRTSSGFGDYHIRIGPPGFLDISGIARVLRRGLDSGFFARQRPAVAVEVVTPAGGDPWETERHGRQVLEQAWALALEMGSR